MNNAGCNVSGAEHRLPIDTFQRADWDKILSVDLSGPFVVTQALVPLLLRDVEQLSANASLEARMHAVANTPPKRIINISSVAGLVPLRLRQVAHPYTSSSSRAA